jgi:putative glutamine amidotransferase
MGRKIVGITCSTRPAAGVESAKQVLNRPYVWAVEQAGGIPIILPVTTDTEVSARYLGVIDGLMLSGGVDVCPERYGQEVHPQLGEVDADRDATELPLIQQALKEDMPLFGICRGIQTLNIAMGGTLYQDLPTQYPSKIVHHQYQLGLKRDAFCHEIDLPPGTRFRSIIGSDKISVNTLHHQALSDVAEGLEVTAYAPDLVVEAVEAPAYRYVLAVQYHPEETAPHDEYSRRLFKAFVEVL